MSMLLDVVEAAESHSGVNLALSFAKILNDFGISSKVSSSTCDYIKLLTCCVDPRHLMR
jgi:hypothetical protein